MTFSKTLRDESGLILIAALTLLTALTLVGATAFFVASTDVKIGGNFRTSQTALQVAMAGSEQARQTLRAANMASANTSNFTEELAARAGGNGVLDGYATSSDDSPLATSNTLVSGYTYNVYLTNDSSDGATSTTDNNSKVVLTSVATGPNNVKAIVIATVKLFEFSGSSPATLYSKDNTTLNGSAITISGNDAGDCGGSDLSAVYVYSDPSNPHSITQNGGPTLTGNPATQTGMTSLDLDGYVNTLKGSASVTLTADVSASGNGTTTYGSETNYVTVYADATQQADGELRLNNVTGYGILLVKGDLQLAGNINWSGIIITTGVVRATGGGSNSKNIQGQIYSGASSLGDTTVSGSVTIGYNSCDVKKALSSQPLKVVNWKQNY